MGSLEPVFKGRHAVLAGGALLAVAVALAATNLRISVTSMSSVLGDVAHDLVASPAWSSAITAAPSVCFGLAAVLAPWLGRRLGSGSAIGVALAVLVAGLFIRVLDGPTLLLLGTFGASSGIAVCNVLIPVVVKESFPKRLGFVTGIYSAALAAGSAIAATLTPLADTAAGSWRPALAVWAVPAFLALVLWLFAARRKVVAGKGSSTAGTSKRRSMIRSPLAWAVTLLFAAQSTYAYVIMGWLPEMLRDAGVGRDTAGALLGVTMVVAVPLNLFVPAIAARRKSQSGLVVALTVLPVLGVFGMLLSPASAPWLWTILLGLGTGIFPVVLTMMSLRTRNSGDTAQLSAMAQGIGYLISSAGPFAAGLIYGALGSWTVPLLLVLAVLVVQAVLGAIVGRPRYI